MRQPSKLEVVGSTPTRVARSHSIMVSTSDSDSDNVCSNHTGTLVDLNTSLNYSSDFGAVVFYHLNAMDCSSTDRVFESPKSERPEYVVKRFTRPL